jgi:transcriptional regulator with XRE-family HTH domain
MDSKSKPDQLQELGRRIRVRRKALGLSQEKFAFESGIDRSFTGGIERGERNISFLTLCRLAVALDCDLGELLAAFPVDPAS